MSNTFASSYRNVDPVRAPDVNSFGYATAAKPLKTQTEQDIIKIPRGETLSKHWWKLAVNHI